MKKVFIALLIIAPHFTMAQNFIGVPYDSVKILISKVEQFTGTKLNLRERGDSLENYLYYDDTRFVQVKVNMINKKTLVGLNVKITISVDYIVISGPEIMMKEIFNNYLKTCTEFIHTNEKYIETKKWKASLQDKDIQNKDGVKMYGLAIWITK